MGRHPAGSFLEIIMQIKKIVFVFAALALAAGQAQAASSDAAAAVRAAAIESMRPPVPEYIYVADVHTGGLDPAAVAAAFKMQAPKFVPGALVSEKGTVVTVIFPSYGRKGVGHWDFAWGRSNIILPGIYMDVYAFPLRGAQ